MIETLILALVMWGTWRLSRAQRQWKREQRQEGERRQ